MMMVLDPVELLGSTLGGAYKVRVEAYDDGTEMGSLNVSLEGSNDGIIYDSFLGDSLLNTSYGSFDGFRDVPPEGAFPGGPI